MSKIVALFGRRASGAGIPALGENAVNSGRTRRTTRLHPEEVLISAAVHLVCELLTAHLYV